MLTLAGVLAPEDVARVVEGLKAATFHDGKKTAGGDARKVKANQQADMREPAVAALGEFVRKAIERHPVVSAYARPALWRLMFNRYGPGETYGMHVDDAMMGKGEERRMRTDLSFTLFLSDPADYDGGGLVIDGLDGEREARLAAGDMIIYPTGALHRVEPVTRGDRLACVGWIQSQIRRADEREILFDLARVRSGMGAGENRLTLDKSISALLRLWGEL